MIARPPFSKIAFREQLLVKGQGYSRGFLFSPQMTICCLIYCVAQFFPSLMRDYAI